MGITNKFSPMYVSNPNDYPRLMTFNANDAQAQISINYYL